MLKNNKWQYVVALFAFLLGILLMVQLRTQQNYLETNAATKLEDIAATLIRVNEASEELAAEVAELRGTLNKYREGENIRNIISEELGKTKMQAGYIAVTGPGLLITLDDSHVEREQDEDFYYIHDWYLRDLVSLLWTGGAEAITINNERLITTSEIFCGGTTIFINNRLVSPPYVIGVIGDEVNLMTSLRMGSILPILEDVQKTYGIVFTVEPAEDVIAPAAATRPNFKFVKTLQS
ncbi:MAG: DUF881 domain-containing protein [bacterium]